METFHGSKPDLVSKNMIKEIEDKLNVTHNDDNNKVIDGIGHFYSNYIRPNLFPLIVVGLLLLYLTIKYIMKKDREEREADPKTKSKKNDKQKKNKNGICEQMMNKKTMKIPN